MSDSVAEWLLENPRGRCSLREAMCFLPTEMVEEFLQRWRPVRVLIKLYRGGEIDVFGPKFVLPKIVRAGRLVSTPEDESEADRRFEAKLPDNYKGVYYPSGKLASYSPKEFDHPVPLWLAGSK